MKTTAHEVQKHAASQYTPHSLVYNLLEGRTACCKAWSRAFTAGCEESYPTDQLGVLCTNWCLNIVIRY